MYAYWKNYSGRFSNLWFSRTVVGEKCILYLRVCITYYDLLFEVEGLPGSVCTPGAPEDTRAYWHSPHVTLSGGGGGRNRKQLEQNFVFLLSFSVNLKHSDEVGVLLWLLGVTRKVKNIFSLSESHSFRWPNQFLVAHLFLHYSAFLILKFENKFVKQNLLLSKETLLWSWKWPDLKFGAEALTPICLVWQGLYSRKKLSHLRCKTFTLDKFGPESSAEVDSIKKRKLWPFAHNGENEGNGYKTFL